ncbi:MAG: sensor histidine kinase [Desertimonas sp.]
MNLRVIRLRLTALYTVLSAIAVIVLAVVGVRVGAERIDVGAQREAEQVIGEVLMRSAQGDEAVEDNTWLVRIGEGEILEWSVPYADTWVEPPLAATAVDAIGWDTSSRRFAQDGVQYLAYGQRINDAEAIVTVVDLSGYEDRASWLRARMAMAALGAIVVIGVVGWVVAGRALRPIRAANTRQRDFIADAAHQLRTPLAVIRASASQTLSRPRDSETYVASLSEIDSAAASASAAVSELLELARIDSGQFSPRLAPVRLDLLAEEVVAGVRVEGCTITTGGDRAVTVDADYALLHHAIENVVRNAAARAAHVEVTVRADGDRALVEVSDDGPGFPPELLPEVFERFRRGDGRGSSGLGLAIARSILDAHRGGATAANRDGGGAVVQLWLRVSTG